MYFVHWEDLTATFLVASICGLIRSTIYYTITTPYSVLIVAGQISFDQC
ncbi:unnamed protein product [Penicillium camemberti]|uniref:Str. FM013 n=1 Tax=Penicillium camemberti (strain FM 013) TaxID=1429867 RepID=A0A0G4PRZ3_PENC3|nr:unnamed protein product [Penicillium camemberti]